MALADSSRELMAWICDVEDVDPFQLAETDDLLGFAIAKGLLADGDRARVEQRLVDLVDRGYLAATDPLGAIDQPVAANDRARMMSELRTTASGRRWVEAEAKPVGADNAADAGESRSAEARRTLSRRL